MQENNPNIVEEYFKISNQCDEIDCLKVIFEQTSKNEWFYDGEYWCYFEFCCEDNEYKLIKKAQKNFLDDCIIKNMSYEIKMLLSYALLRNITTIEKDLLTQYINKYENEKQTTPSLKIEEFNLIQNKKENEALKHSKKIANRIMGGCLLLFLFVVILFIFAIISHIRANYLN